MSICGEQVNFIKQIDASTKRDLKLQYCWTSFERYMYNHAVSAKLKMVEQGGAKFRQLTWNDPIGMTR